MTGVSDDVPAERPRAATPRTARLINDRAAFDLLLSRGPLTRSELGALTGLSRPTVADLIERLRRSGLVTTAGEAGARRRGPNATLYTVVADRALVAGVEVRPPQLTAVLADITGRTVAGTTLRLDPGVRPDTQVLTALDRASRQLAEHGVGTGHGPDHEHTGRDRPASDRRVGAVVVGTPGLVDPTTGDVAYVAGLPGWHHNLLTGLRERLGVPVRVDNEVNLVGLAEHRHGAGRGRRTFALLSVGDGLGVAVVLGDQLHRGASGGAGEIGYLPLNVTGGNLAELAGGAAILELGRSHGLQAREPATAVRAAVAAGRTAFLDELGERVALGAAGVCAVLDPGFLVLAGPVGLAGGDVLAERVATRLRSLTPLRTEVRAGQITDQPVVRGAIGTARQLLLRELFPH